MTSGLRIEKLRRDHRVDDFDCGEEALNRFLGRFAFQAQQAGSSQTYLALDGDEIAGFYSLAVGSVAHTDAPERLAKGLARHPIPVMLLARLAVSIRHQGKGIGAGLLRDAELRTLQAGEIAGIRALTTHAKDDAARRFYEYFEFLASPTDPLHLFILLKDLKATVTPRPRRS